MTEPTGESRNMADSARPFPPWVPAVTVCVALAMWAIAALWLLDPDTYPFGAADRVTVSVTHLLEHLAAAILLVALGVLGSVSAVLLRRSAIPGRTTLATWLLAAQFLCLLLVFGDVSMMTTLGYLGMLAGAPVAFVALVAAALRRRRGAAPALMAVGALIGAGAWAGFLKPPTLVTYLGNLAGAFGDYGARLAWGLGSMALIVAVGLVVLQLCRGPAMRWSERLDAEQVRRWGVRVTLVAAACPLPYALERLTWLTPWPIGMGEGPDSLAVRTQGMMIGLGALAGIALTLALITRFGEVFPGWLPIIGGRQVPVAAAVVPGGLVALAAAMAAPGWIVNAFTRFDGADLVYALVLGPFPIWAPALAAAVVLYALRRGWRPGRAEAPRWTRRSREQAN